MLTEMPASSPGPAWTSRSQKFCWWCSISLYLC